ncbi:CPBP family intramembrane glutamic endopeptidase [Natronorarus salvus]|uniref:CPBP family intramembrane glutamic endopeptidase n=1 Tax=Natronorarus salvus TaxID=3117733 RepID=UPI002F26388C
MTPGNSVRGGISGSRLTLFLGVLLVSMAGFVGFSWISGRSFLSLLVPYMFTPMIAALIVCYWDGISLSTVGLRVGRARWLVVAVVIVFPIVGAVTAISTGIPGVAFDPAASDVPGLDLTAGLHEVLPIFGLLLLTGITVNSLVALGEEFGWRGYLLWELAPLGFWRASFGIGVVWGLWHTPGIVAGHNYPSFPVLGVVLMTLFCTLLAPLYTYLVIRSRSVLPAAVFHGVFNTFALTIAVTSTPDTVVRELVASEAGLVGLVVFVLIAVVIAIAGPPRLTREFARKRASRPSVASTV